MSEGLRNFYVKGVPTKVKMTIDFKEEGGFRIRRVVDGSFDFTLMSWWNSLPEVKTTSQRNGGKARLVEISFCDAMGNPVGSSIPYPTVIDSQRDFIMLDGQEVIREELNLSIVH